MASVILTNWTVYYADDAGAGAGMKQIKWTGGGAPETHTNTVNQLYSAIADLFSIADQNDADDTIPIRAVTPAVYEIGAFDAGDLEPWFIDRESTKHLTGGSLESVGWDRVPLPADGTGNIGIIMVQCNSGGFGLVAGDIGDTCTHTDGDTGWILDVDATNYQIWIRPADNTLANDFNSTTGGTITATGSSNASTQTTSVVGESGEVIYSNIFTLGTIEANTVMYIFQNYNPVTPFWGVGHIDRLLQVYDSFNGGFIDYGQLKVFARQYSKFYDYYITDASGGGRNPVPIATTADSNNTAGYWQTVFSSSTGVWAKGQTFTNDADPTIEGTVTSATGSNPDTIQYYLSGPNLAPFPTGAVTSSGAGSPTGNVQTPTAVGPANLAAITIIFGQAQKDIGDGGNNQPYDVAIDCGGNLLADFYQYTKYITRRGNADDIDDGGQTIEGQAYVTAGEIRLSYDTQTVEFLKGETLTGQSSGATGTITADHDTGGATGILIIRDVRGTFSNDEQILDSQGTPGNAYILASNGIETTAIIKGAPFGNLAGVKFFGARGVWIENMHADDANNYQLLDSNNVPRDPPTTVPISVTVKDVNNTAIENAQVFVRKSTAYYNYTSHNANNTAGSTTFEVNEVVDTDLLQTGWLHVWDADTNTKQEYRYQSWTGKIFTLNTEVTGSATSTDGTTPTTKLISTSTNFLTADFEEGDTIRNTTTGAWAVIDEIVDADNITTSALSSGQWTSGNNFSIHKLAVTYTNADLVDIPLMNKQTNAGGVASATYAGSTPINIVVRIRLNEGTPKYVPFNTSGSIGTAGFSLTAILTEDTVAT